MNLICPTISTGSARHSLYQHSILKLLDLASEEVRYLLDVAHKLKHAKRAGIEVQQLKGKNIALVFEKASTRTRCAFEVAVHDQGGHVTYMDPSGSQMGHKEPLKDTARVLGRYFDAIEYRGFHQEKVEELAHFSGVPVFNGLSDEFHPTQVLADLMTMEESSGRALNQLSLCYLGDARFNMGNSLLIGAAMMGMDVRIAAPKLYWPSEDILGHAKRIAQHTGAKLQFTEDPLVGVNGADFIYTDVWVSMGEADSVWQARIEALSPYRVTSALMRASGKKNTQFMHCLPALHNLDTHLGQQIHAKFGCTELEVTDEVFESAASAVFDQAENRLHTIKALLVTTLAA